MLDIVMLVHDQAKWARLAAQAVESFTRNKFRLIVVDNKSVEPDTQKLFEELEARGHTIVRLAENKSFSNGMNAGIRAGTNKSIVLLNSDALVTPGWDTQILQTLTRKNVGLVGTRTNYAAGLQGLQGEGAERQALSVPVEFLMFVCVGMRRDTYDMIGPLDEETFDGFSSEDLDYSWRVRKAGLELVIAPTYVFHGGSQTLQATVGYGEALNANNAKYNQRLIDKHGPEILEALQRGPLPRVFVSTFSAEEWTRTDFMKWLVNLRTGGYPFAYYHHKRSPIHFARQAVAAHALADKFGYVLMIDDDMVEFPPDTLVRLMAHKKDVVVTVAYQRIAPFGTCVFKWADGPHTEKDSETGQVFRMMSSMEGIEDRGLQKIDAAGLSCALIKTDVFKRLSEGVGECKGVKKWFGNFGKVGEDNYFFNKITDYNEAATKAGKPLISTYCDTDIVIGHLGEAQVVNRAFKEAVRGKPQPVKAL